MDQIVSIENVDGILKAYTHIWNTSFGFMKSMCLKCAIELGIPDIIHKNGKPISLPDLISCLPIHPSKTQHVYRLMRILADCGFFSLEKCKDNDNEEKYSLTPSSCLLIRNSSLNFRSNVSLVLEPLLVHPFEHLTTWFKNDDATPLFTSSGDTFWGLCKEPRINNLFNESLASDSVLTGKIMVAKCKEVFEGIDSLVDVGGGTGNMARAIVETFPNMSCTVLDQLHVVEGLEGTHNLNFVVGDFFKAIPPADAILLKLILHDWSDEQCVEILKNSKEAITKKLKGKEGKIIVIEIVMGNPTLDHDFTEAQLLFDIGTMSCVEGKERTEKEWANLFFDAGFSSYKIHPILGPRSLIELFP